MTEPLSSDDFDSLRRLLKIATDSGLSEVSVTLRDGLDVTVKTALSPQAAPPSVTLPAYSPQAQPHLPAASRPEPTARPSLSVTSPMVGIFYHAATPDDPPFIKLGDIVTVGQTIGLIEAMKVFSEVPSEAAGRIVDIAVENGQLVQLGQALLHLEPA